MDARTGGFLRPQPARWVPRFVAGAPVPLPRLLTIAAPYLYTHGRRGVGELATASVAELQRRWQHVLGPPSSDRLSRRLA